MRAAIVALAIAGCSFDPSGSAHSTDDGGAAADAGATADASAGVDATAADDASPAIDARSVDSAPGVPDAPIPPPDAMPPPVDADPCPAGYDLVATGTCHRVVTTAANWLTAEQDCEDDAAGAHLVVVNDAAENALLSSYRWIGLSERVTDGVFLWATGAPQTYTAYAAGEPAAGGGQCVVTRPDGWHDDGCDEAKAYVCEYDGTPADPTAY